MYDCINQIRHAVSPLCGHSCSWPNVPPGRSGRRGFLLELPVVAPIGVQSTSGQLGLSSARNSKGRRRRRLVNPEELDTRGLDASKYRTVKSSKVSSADSHSGFSSPGCELFQTPELSHPHSLPLCRPGNTRGLASLPLQEPALRERRLRHQAWGTRTPADSFRNRGCQRMAH